MKKPWDSDWWIGLVVRCVCGALFGAFLGLGLWWEVLPSEKGWIVVLISLLICSTLAAIFQDDFWMGLVRRW